jgi:hypothetical protein
MSRVTVTVPIQLVRDAGGFWLQVISPTTREAAVSIENMSGDVLIRDILGEWASHTFKEAQLKGRRSTGLKDAKDKPIHEGDIVRVRHSDVYPSATGVVTWAPQIGAFVLQGMTERHGAWSTQNLQGVGSSVIIGNVFESPDCYQPAVYTKMPNED